MPTAGSRANRTTVPARRHTLRHCSLPHWRARISGQEQMEDARCLELIAGASAQLLDARLTALPTHLVGDIFTYYSPGHSHLNCSSPTTHLSAKSDATMKKAFNSVFPNKSKSSSPAKGASNLKNTFDDESGFVGMNAGSLIRSSNAQLSLLGESSRFPDCVGLMHRGHCLYYFYI